MVRKTYIKVHTGEYDDELLEILNANPQFWGGVEIEDALHAQFFDVIDENGFLLGFFGNAYWNNAHRLKECVVCCVYVKEQFRKQGIFKKIIRYSINRNSDADIITIGAMTGNQLAFDIYNKLFTYSHFDKDTDGYWFIIKDRRRF